MILNKLKLWLILVLCIAQLSCENKSASIEAEKEAVKQTLISMWDAIENKDIESYASYIHPDFTQFGETDSILRVGKIAEVEGINSWIETSENIKTRMHDPRVTIKNNVAWIIYYWSDQGSTDGVDFATRGKSTRIFVKENDAWLCIHGHYTLLP